MQLLINIDADTYKDIKMGKIYTSVRDVPQESVVAIANGTPLSKELSELLAEQDMRIVALAYAHAHYLKTYGVDIVKALHTATENAEMMAKAHQQGYYDALNQIRQIKEIEEPRWIPVRERLPEKSDDFIVSVINNKYGVVIVTEAYFESKNDHDDIEESKWREFGPNETVIAWMPEPEPYKPEREEKNGIQTNNNMRK